jgi:hypothetical protein
MAYDVLCRDRDGRTELLESNIATYNGAQKSKVAHQKRVKPKFVYIKKH